MSTQKLHARIFSAQLSAATADARSQEWLGRSATLSGKMAELESQYSFDVKRAALESIINADLNAKELEQASAMTYAKQSNTLYTTNGNGLFNQAELDEVAEVPLLTPAAF